jgi:hypothetical protein
MSVSAESSVLVVANAGMGNIDILLTIQEPKQLVCVFEHWPCMVFTIFCVNLLLLYGASVVNQGVRQ